MFRRTDRWQSKRQTARGKSHQASFTKGSATVRSSEYVRMIAARDATQTQLKKLNHRLRREAEVTVKSPSAHRGDTAWRKCDERAYQTALSHLRHGHRSEIGALEAKNTTPAACDP
ncbi:MAG: hypothetical protein WBA51_14885 [Erythrobacter sp.]